MAVPPVSSATGNLTLYDTPPGIVVARLAAVRDGEAQGFRLALPTGWFSGFVVRRGETIHGYLDRCPHAGVRLERGLHGYLSADGTMIACSWHGALFDIASGACRGGPCGGQRLAPWPLAIVDGMIVTA